MCQIGTREGRIEGVATLPSPLRAPTVSPPCPLPTPKVTLSVPFWHSSACPGHSGAGAAGKAICTSIGLDYAAGGVHREGRRGPTEVSRRGWDWDGGRLGGASVSLAGLGRIPPRASRILPGGRPAELAGETQSGGAGREYRLRRCVRVLCCLCQMPGLPGAAGRYNTELL